MQARFRTGVRIIGGRWKGRRIPVLNVPGLRPTSDRIRETLFNWLQRRIEGARCLDVFAGSGALSFEALSRGAAEVVAVDSHRHSINTLKKTSQLLGTQALTVVHDKAEKLLAKPAYCQFDIVFVDPPFELLLYEVVCKLLDENGWLSTAAFIYVETVKGYELTHPNGWSLQKSAHAGNVDYRLFQARPHVA